MQFDKGDLVSIVYADAPAVVTFTVRDFIKVKFVDGRAWSSLDGPSKVWTFFDYETSLLVKHFALINPDALPEDDAQGQ
jgi:hypothetical protein